MGLIRSLEMLGARNVRVWDPVGRHQQPPAHRSERASRPPRVKEFDREDRRAHTHRLPARHAGSRPRPLLARTADDQEAAAARPVVPRPLRALDRRPDGLDREDAAGSRPRPDDHDVQPAHRRARDLAADAVPAARSRRTRGSRSSRSPGSGDGWREHSHQIHTPDGDLDYSYRTEDGFGTSCHDFLLKGDEPETKLAGPPPLPLRRPLRHVGARRAWSRRSATRPGGCIT